MQDFNNMVLIKKYQPKTLDDLILPDRILEKLHKGPYQDFLFYGSPGNGKCVTGDTIITIRNKKTGKVEKITMLELKKLANNPSEP